MISQLRKHQLTGDYARVLYKLSQALMQVHQHHNESEDLAIEAKALYQTIKKAPPKAGLEEEEKPWDDLVCVLWR